VFVTTNDPARFTKRHRVRKADLTVINGAVNNFIAIATGT